MAKKMMRKEKKVAPHYRRTRFADVCRFYKQEFSMSLPCVFVIGAYSSLFFFFFFRLTHFFASTFSRILFLFSIHQTESESINVGTLV